jgi:uncharacterized hydantoinase/oxoprolinase family protein
LGYRIAAELFATTLDVYLLLGYIPEDAKDANTTDGRPATKAYAEARIARMFCADVETSTAEDRREVAEKALNYQTQMLSFMFKQVAGRLPTKPNTLLFAGEGEFLIPLALKRQNVIQPCRVVSLSREFGPEISRAACAYAVAILAAEMG